MARFSDEDVNRILLGPAAISRVAFPMAQGIDVGLRCISDDEIDKARVAAHCYLEGICKRADLGLRSFVDIDPESLNREQQRQIIAIAFVDADQPTRPFFDDAIQVRRLSSVVVARLWELYLDHQDKVNPYFNLSNEQVKELADALKKEQPGADLLAGFARDTLCSLVRTLASQQST